MSASKEECLNIIRSNIGDTLIEVLIVKKDYNASNDPEPEIVFSDNSVTYLEQASTAYDSLKHDWYNNIIEKFEKYKNKDNVCYSIHMHLTFFPNVKDISRNVMADTDVINFNDSMLSPIKTICMSERVCLRTIIAGIINKYKETL